MPQSSQQETVYRARIEKLREAMKEFGLQAVVIEPGPTMMYFTGVQWGRSERTFALVVPLKGKLGFVLPGFEEMRARERIPAGADIRIWQEDESPYQLIVQILKDRDITSGRVGMDPNMRYFVFDGVRKLAPQLQYVSADAAVRAAISASEAQRR